MAAKHTPPGDDSFRTSLLRNLGGGAALVILVAAVFFGVGQLTGPESAPEVAGSAEESDEDAPEDESDRDGGSETVEEPDESDADDEARDDAEEREESEEPEGSEEPDESEEPEESEEAEEADDADETETTDDADQSEETDDEGAAATEEDEREAEAEREQQAARIAPGDITVQVLDGVGTDGGAAAQGVAGDLGDIGYRVIAQNPALAYEQTTVLWTSGNEDRARQVAADIGAAAVRQQPGNLSEQVDVHVVVGADRA